MSYQLLLTESPAKKKKLAQILGDGWRVEATLGHIRDLPKDELGVDVGAGFRPRYKVLARQGKNVKRLLKALKGASAVYVATDLDREGEAIAWHVLQVAKLPASVPVARVAFTAITASAVQAAIAAPRALDVNLVEAQQTRRIIDRLVGYLVSPVVCQALDGQYSAGRVQSACLRLVVDREQEIVAFEPVSYWILDAKLQAAGGELVARLHTLKNQSAERLPQAVVSKLVGGLQRASYWVSRIQSDERRRQPPAPFTTSTMQQAANCSLDLSPDRCMQIAQQLYEAGLITYHRTDGGEVAPEAQQAALQYIARAFGGDYVPNQPNNYQAKTKYAQEAHEAIRPTDITRLPEQVDGDGAALYRLIWQRSIAAQMAPARYATQVVEIQAGQTRESPFPLTFQARGRRLLFDGFLRVYEEPIDPDADPDDEVGDLPALQQNEQLTLLDVLPAERKTKAPPRFTEASLVRELERQGIGRPSTYATMVQTIQQREYVQVQRKRLVPTETGQQLHGFLLAHFPDLFAVPYTAQLESALDGIAQGQTSRSEVIQAFWTEFTPQLGKAGQVAQLKAKKNHKQPELTGEACPSCGGDLVQRKGKRGPFIGCMNYPDCGYTEAADHKPVTLRGV